MFTTVCRRFAWQTRIVLLGILLAVPGYGQGQPQTPTPSKVTGQVLTPAATVDTDSTRAPLVLTLQDALTRAKANEIRTLGTGLDGARVDVSASCTESNTSENLEDCALAMQSC
jgi:hypothetical protein